MLQQLRFSGETEEIATPVMRSDHSVHVNELYRLLGHASEAAASALAKHYGVKLVGKFQTSSACAAVKARQKIIPKEIPEASRWMVLREKRHLDISSIQARSFGGATFWLLVLDEAA